VAVHDVVAQVLPGGVAELARRGHSAQCYLGLAVAGEHRGDGVTAREQGRGDGVATCFAFPSNGGKLAP